MVPINNPISALLFLLFDPHLLHVSALASNTYYGNTTTSAKRSGATYSRTTTSARHTASTFGKTSVSVGGTSPARRNDTLPLTGTGLVYASACNAAKQSWVAAGGSVEIPTATSLATDTHTSCSYTIPTTTLTFLTNSTAYTLCDGFPRLDGYTSVISSQESFCTPQYSTHMITQFTTKVIPTPSCTIQSNDCAFLTSSYNSASSIWNAEYEGFVTTAVTSPSGNPPICGTIDTASAFATDVIDDGSGGPICFQNFASIRLLYWPVITASGDLCQGNRSTKTMGPTIAGKANTFQTWNTTLVSPTVYMQFDGTWQYKTGASTISTQSRLLLPQNPRAVSSYCATGGSGHGRLEAVNYADLEYPVPASAYRCQPRCFTSNFVESGVSTITYEYFTLGTTGTATYEMNSGFYTEYGTANLCSTIWSDLAPALSVPPEFSSMVPKVDLGHGVTCSFDFNYDPVFFDPPKALAQASSVIGVSTSSVATKGPSVTAEPVGSPSSSTPRQTSTEDPHLMSIQSAAVPSKQSHVDPPATSADPEQSQQSAAATDASSSPVRQDPASSNPPAQASNDPEPANSSPGIGGIIASAFGITRTQNSDSASAGDDPAVTSSVGAAAASSIADLSSSADPPATTQQNLSDDPSSPSDSSATSAKPAAVITSLLGHSQVGAQSSDLADPVSVVSVGEATGAVLTGEGSQIITVSVQPTGGVLIGPTALVIGQSASIAGIGNVVAGPSGIVASGTSVVYSALDPASSQPPADPTGAVLPGQGGELATFSVLPSGGVVVGSATLQAGESTSVPGVGNVVAGSSDVIVSGTTVAYTALAPASSQAPAVLTGQNGAEAALSRLSLGGVLVGSAMVDPGNSISVPGVGIVVAGSSELLAPGTTVAYSVIDGSNETPQAAGQTPASVLTFAGRTHAADSATAFSIGSGTVLSPGVAVTVSGATLSLGPSASYLVSNGLTLPLRSGPATAQVGTQSTIHEFSVAGTTFAAAGTSPVVLGSGLTLHPGGPALTVSGQTISLAASGSYLVVDGATQTLQLTGPAPVPNFTFGGKTYTANSATELILGSLTLAPGHAITVSGKTLSLAPSASFLVVDGTTQTAQTAESTPVPVFTFDGKTFTANSATGFAFGSTTLAPEHAVTVSGTTFSLAPSASFLVVDGTTEMPHVASQTPEPVLTFEGRTFTADSATDYVLGGTTLAPGHAVTVSGITLSLAPSASFLVSDGVTMTLEVGSVAASQAPSRVSGKSSEPTSATATHSGSDASSAPTRSHSSAMRPFLPNLLQTAVPLILSCSLWILI